MTTDNKTPASSNRITPPVPEYVTTRNLDPFVAWVDGYEVGYAAALRPTNDGEGR